MSTPTRRIIDGVLANAHTANLVSLWVNATAEAAAGAFCRNCTDVAALLLVLLLSERSRLVEVAKA
jgi:hypothetical protein